MWFLRRSMLFVSFQASLYLYPRVRNVAESENILCTIIRNFHSKCFPLGKGKQKAEIEKFRGLITFWRGIVPARKPFKKGFMLDGEALWMTSSNFTLFASPDWRRNPRKIESPRAHLLPWQFVSFSPCVERNLLKNVFAPSQGCDAWERQH